MAEENSPPPVIVNISNSNSESADNGNSTDEMDEPVTIIETEIPNEPSAGESNSVDEYAEPTANGENNAVEIARINAERDVTIAAITAESERDTASRNVEELEECRTRIANLETQVEELRNSLIPPPPLEETPIPEEQVAIAGDNSEIVQETNSTQEFTQVPTVEIGTELSDVREDVNRDLETIKPRFIPI